MTLRTLSWGLVLIAVLALAGCARRPPRREPEPPQPKTTFQPPKWDMRGVDWRLPDAQGRPLWEVHAESGAGESRQGVAELRGVRCKVYADGKLALEAEAPRVKADQSAKTLALLGGVTARAADHPRSFRAERVSLTVKGEQRAVVEAAGAVRLELDGVVITGETLVTDPHLSEGRLLP